MALQVTITVEREARGEGDRPAVLYVTSAQFSSAKIDPREDAGSIEKAVDEAYARLRGAIGAFLSVDA